ncbi:unnamed protein product [Linum trigynum]|uniref:Retrotransposon Copia-like N-terminal domain-containing protein n=1 Tax=Linum trigynum TaxID=586398 RepID=A0AAV2GAW9_9ROSI
MTGSSGTTDSTSESKIVEAQIITFNPAAQLPLKLTPTNFASWRSQLETLLMGFDLIGFIDGSNVAPPQSISADGAATANPAYRNWFRQDKLILHALRCSIDESIYSFVSAASTARDAWLILEKLYASNAQSRINHLKGKIGKITRGDRDVLAFVNDLKSTAAELALIGEPVKDLDLVVHCLRGLGDDYKAFFAAVRARGPGLTVEDLVDSLVEYESDLKSQQHTIIPTAFYTQGQRSDGHPRSPRGAPPSQPYRGASPSRGQQGLLQRASGPGPSPKQAGPGTLHKCCFSFGPGLISIWHCPFVARPLCNCSIFPGPN